MNKKVGCKYCGRDGLHLCRGSIDAYNASLTEEERQERHKQRMESLHRAMEASRKLKELGIECVC